ncbi:peptidylprolyl isomerase [Calothrix sp. FACHB-1219]|uniref:peptidylprolyl isomerase n=1 Tax=unclassified Calothrix TaxID=2619626 RepID=UPI001682AD49|nr:MULTISPECIES: peptidylprolyl isomerase [unclassified Calothrix]MBD2201900.1 peptidylprolyl isomerase [Calothrix sp. FACHB-168]MBD2216935.1 peptidylprolyl isomerase [Calothrix sp. FACHB-1219]
MTTQKLQLGNENLQTEQLLSLLNRYQLLPQVLRAKVIDEAIASFSCTEAEYQEAIANFREYHQLTSPEKEQAWLQKNLVTPPIMRELAIRPRLIQKFQLAIWGNKLESYFLQRKADLDRVTYSMIRTQDEGLAQELYFRIVEGEHPFATIAQQYSQGSEAQTGGLIGPVPLSQPHPIIQQILSVSQPGQIWKPHLIADWYVIIRLEQLIPTEFNENTQQYLLNELFEAWIEEEIKTRLESANYCVEYLLA